MKTTPPPLAETVKKYVTETKAEEAVVRAAITEFANNRLRTTNLDMAAYHWVKSKGADPPPMTGTAATFSSIEQVLTLGEAKKQQANTSLKIRGFVLGYRPVNRKDGKPMGVFMLADESGIGEVLCFTNVPAYIEGTLKPQPGDLILIEGCQAMPKQGNATTSPVSMSQMNNGKFGAVMMKNPPTSQVSYPTLPAFDSLTAKPLKELHYDETVTVKGTISSVEQNSYIGCAQCKSKWQKDAPQEGKKGICPGNPKKTPPKPSCGMVVAEKFTFTKVSIFDDTGNLDLNFGPEYVSMFPAKVGELWYLKKAIAVGTLTKGEDFYTNWFALEEQYATVAPKAPVTTTTTITPTQTVATPLSTTSSPTTSSPAMPPTVSVTSVPNTPLIATASPPAPTATIQSSLGKLETVLLSYLAVFKADGRTMENFLGYGQAKKHGDEEAIKTTIATLLGDGKIRTENNKFYPA